MRKGGHFYQKQKHNETRKYTKNNSHKNKSNDINCISMKLYFFKGKTSWLKPISIISILSFDTISSSIVLLIKPSDLPELITFCSVFSNSFSLYSWVILYKSGWYLFKSWTNKGVVSFSEFLKCLDILKKVSIELGDLLIISWISLYRLLWWNSIDLLAIVCLSL